MGPARTTQGPPASIRDDDPGADGEARRSFLWYSPPVRRLTPLLVLASLLIVPLRSEAAGLEPAP
ncbi:MAG TPA: hypothetical protein VGD74_01530, partial [Vulgatibacter sp.]